MGFMDQARTTSILSGIMTGGTVTFPLVLKLKLGSTSPTSTSNMTELSGTGYTTGGNTVTWGTTTAAVNAGPAVAQSWTNGSGGAWTINGLEIWDTAGTPLRWIQGSWNGAPVSVAIGNTFQVAISGITETATAW
jgi:hypothetical protein